MNLKKYLLLPYLLIAFTSSAQLFSESFAYPEGLTLDNLGWTVHSGGTTNPQTTVNGLNFGEAPLNGGLSISGSGQDVHSSFTAQNSQIIYASVLVNISAASSSGEYFLHLGPHDLGTNFRARIFVKEGSDGGINFGVSKSSNSPNYSLSNYEKGKTYQLVLKYTFLSGSATDDVVELFVLEKYAETEPSTSTKAQEEKSDSPNIGSVAIRQGSSSKAATLILDEIRVASTWLEAVSLKRASSMALVQPEILYTFSSNCAKATIFRMTLNAFRPEKSLTLNSASKDVLFSTDNKNWYEKITFTSLDQNYYEQFYFKFLPSKVLSENSEIEISLVEEAGEKLQNFTIHYEVYSASDDCIMNIADAKNVQLADSVFVAGRITASANEFPDFNYLEDSSGGVRIEGDFGFEIGDSVQFNGLLSELNLEKVLLPDAINGHQVFSNSGLSPKTIELSELSDYEGQLVTINDVELQDKNFVFFPNTNESVEKSNRVLPVRIWSSTLIDGHEKPQDTFNITGVVGQYRGQFQLYPRLLTDVQNIGEIPTVTLPLAKESTFDLAAWNLEWFGSEGNGPVDDELQMANAISVMKEMEADVFVLEEITNLSAFNELVEGLMDYDGVCSPAVSGGGEPENAQRVCFVFKNETVKMVELRPLLKGTTPINDYPDTFDRFWASGRLPALFVCDVEIEDVKRRLHIIGIHARANRNNADEIEEVYSMRKVDIQVLKDSLDRHFSLASVIMAGDYNDDVDESVVSGFPVSTYAPFVEDAANWKVLSKELSDRGEKSYMGFDNVIDHIMISDELFDSALEMGTELKLPFVNIEGYPDNTSDHLPIMSRFLLKSVLTAKEYSEVDSVMVFPNPTKGRFGINIEAELNFEAKLFTLSGELLAKQKGAKEVIERKLSKKLLKEPAGVYLLRLNFGNSAKSYKIVKQ